MKAEIYRLLNQDTKAWWHHRNLREAGKHEEARDLERRSIKSDLFILRNAYLFSVGAYGWTIHYDSDKENYSSCRLQGYGGINAPEIHAAILIGVPGFDVTESAHKHFKAILRAPLEPRRSDQWDEPREDGTYGSLNYAPVSYLLQYYHDECGAVIYNYEVKRVGV